MFSTRLNLLNKWVLFFSVTFILLFINSFSFPHPLLPDTGEYMAPFFERIAKWFGNHVFHLKQPYTSALVSDSTGLYIHAFVLLIFSALVALLWTRIGINPEREKRLRYWFITGISYYLALQLLTYGFSKLFKSQFYLPEPNTLFTPLGQLQPDLLYWSTMGISRSYSIFAGALEIIAATLLLFRKTRTSGALLALCILTEVLALNLCFGISVKLYSAFLIVLSLIIVSRGLRRLFYLRYRNRDTGAVWIPDFNSPARKWIYRMVKVMTLVLLFSDSLFPYISNSNYNDDHAPRPFLHGAWETILFVKNQDTLPPLPGLPDRWKRMFIHRRGYFITQNMNDEMQDFELDYDTLKRQLLINKYRDTGIVHIHYRQLSESTLELQGKIRGDSVRILLRKYNLGKLPLLQKDFHWTIDN